MRWNKIRVIRVRAGELKNSLRSFPLFIFGLLAAALLLINMINVRGRVKSPEGGDKFGTTGKSD